MTTETYAWYGQFGAKYTFAIYPLQDYWAKQRLYEVPGIYIYAKRSPPQPGEVSAVAMLFPWDRPIYIGQTENLATRIDRYPDEDTWRCITDHGATHIHVYPNVRTKDERLQIEDTLVEWQNPICNA